MSKPIMGVGPDERDYEEKLWNCEEGEDYERRLAT
jgi:hypothetical protein